MQDVLALVKLALNLGLIAVALTVGLQSRWSDVTYMFRHRHLLARMVLARNVVVPVAALLIVSVLPLELPVRAALLAASVTAVPPFLPEAEARAGVRDTYGVALLASQTLLAIVLVPLTLGFFNFVLDASVAFSAKQVVSAIGRTLMLPLAVGIVVRARWPTVADAVGPRLGWISSLIVLGTMAAIVVVAAPQVLAQLGNGTVLAMALLTLAGLAAGHVIGGPRDEDRTALSLAAASCHPGLAIAVIATNTAAQARGAMAALLLYLLVGMVFRYSYSTHRRSVADTMRRVGVDRRATPRATPERRHVVG